MNAAADPVARALGAEHLQILGGFHPGPSDTDLGGIGTLVLVGPAEPGFWSHVCASSEFVAAAGKSDPLDRWSHRVISAIAAELGAVAFFPFGGPPYRPFIDWARRSGRAWASPAGLLVHDQAGLMVSYRGALGLGARLPLPERPERPCDTCADRPCLSACPAGALGGAAYDVDACHRHLGRPEGRACMARGCAARRACPVSKGYGRREEQSAFHMRAFHP